MDNDQTKKTINQIIENFSPAYLALESEVLSQSYPVLLIFFKNNQWNKINTIIEPFTQKIKIVKINADNLFKLAEDFEITKFPTFLIMKSRQELNRLEQYDETKLKSFIKTIKK